MLKPNLKTKQDSFSPTEEQQICIDVSKTGKNIAIHAGAGCTKTSTLEMIARNLKHKSILYIAFNKSVAEEAQKRFPSNTVCKTIHSIAYDKIVRKTGFAKWGRIIGYWDRKAIQDLISNPFIDASSIIEILTGFCQSAEKDIYSFYEKTYPFSENDTIISVASTIWGTISNPKGNFKITHDVYLKLFQLSNPDLSEYDVIMLDEFQDTNPVCLDIFLSQKENGVQLIAVGDEAQAIYSWRGAVNAFDYISNESWEHLTLSESFRFGKNIEEIANQILYSMNSKLILKGRGVNNENSKSEAILVRNNSTLFDYLLHCADNNKKVLVIADLKDLWSKLWTAFWMRKSRDENKTDYGKYPDPYIKGFGTWKELCNSSEPEAKKIVKILTKTNDVSFGEFTGLIAAQKKVDSCIVVDENLERPDVVLVSGHKSKGLEWDYITIADDFIPYFNPKNEDIEETWNKFVEEQGLNLLYVAVTRAKKDIFCSKHLTRFISCISEAKHCNFYNLSSLLSEMYES